MRTSIAVSIVISALACAEVGVEGDGRDDDFLAAGKADTAGVQPGSPEAQAVLAVVNTASRATLEEEVGLVGSPNLERAADNIVTYRVGDDGQVGTADDEVFDTLAELDAVPYVGPVVFSLLLEHALATQPRPELFNLDALCDGPPLSAGGFDSFFAPDSERTTVGGYQTARRTRHCHEVTGCGPWTAAPSDLAGDIVFEINITDPHSNSYSSILLTSGDDIVRACHAPRTATDDANFACGPSTEHRVTQDCLHILYRSGNRNDGDADPYYSEQELSYYGQID